MTKVTTDHTEKDLGGLIERVRAGEEILIARGDEPMNPGASLVPIREIKEPRKPGTMKGKLNLPDAFFFEPLPEDELKLWSGEGDDRS